MTKTEIPTPKELAAACIRAGWRVRTGTNHLYVIYPPNGARPIVIGHKTKGQIRDQVRDARRAGLDI